MKLPAPIELPVPTAAPRRSRTRRFVAMLALAGLILGSGALMTSTASAKGWAYDLAGELMSPFCPGRTLSSCPSPQAAELVQWISVQEAAGVSREEVIEILVAKHGEEILGAPPAEGITLWAYIFPIAGFLGGGAIAVLVIWRLVGGSKTRLSPAVAQAAAVPSAGAPGDAASASIPGDDELAEIVQRELAARG